MSNYKIENGINLPKITGGTALKYPFNKMDVGQSFWIPVDEDPTGMRIRTAASAYYRRHPDYRFRVASVGSGGAPGWRVWRVPVGASSPATVVAASALVDDGPPDELRPNGKKKGRIDQEVDQWMETGVVGPLLEMLAEKNGQSVEEYVSEFNQEAAGQEIVTK